MIFSAIFAISAVKYYAQCSYERAGGDAFNTGIHGMIIDRRDMIDHLCVRDLVFIGAHEIGENGTLHGMLYTSHSVHLSIPFYGLDRTLLLANKAVLRTSGIILVRPGYFGQ